MPGKQGGQNSGSKIPQEFDKLIAERRAQISTGEEESKAKKAREERTIESKGAWSKCMKWREQEARKLEENRKNWGKMIHRKVETPRVSKVPSEPKIVLSTKSKFGLSGEGSWSVGTEQLREVEVQAIKYERETIAMSKKEWTHKHNQTGRNHFSKFLAKKGMTVETVLLEDMNIRHTIIRMEKLILLFLSYLAAEVTPKQQKTGEGPASTLATYASQAIRWIMEEHTKEFELDQVARWELVKNKIINPWATGREHQLIEIRGVRNRLHKSPIGLKELLMFLKLDEIWRKFDDVTRVKLQALFADLYMNGHRRSAVCPEDFSPFRHLSRKDIQFFDRQGKEVTSYDPQWLREKQLQDDLCVFIRAEPTSKGDPQGKIWRETGNGNAHNVRVVEGQLNFGELMLRQEEQDPVLDLNERKLTAFFNEPQSKKPFKVDKINTLFIKLLRAMFATFYKKEVSEKEAKRIFGLHSFRIGLVVTLMSLGASDSVIQNAGRWSSKAFKVYDRPDLLRTMRVSAALQSTKSEARSQAQVEADIPSSLIGNQETKIFLQQAEQTKLEEESFIIKDEGGNIRSLRFHTAPEVSGKMSEEEEVEIDEEIARPLDRVPSAQNWEEVIPVGRKLRRKFPTGARRCKVAWYWGEIVAVKIKDAFPVEAVFKDGDDHSWSWNEIRQEMESGVLQFYG